MLKINIQNQIRQTKLPKNKPLLPLFEAVTNSLQAIEQRNGKDGKITVEIVRAAPLPGISGDPRIESIRITDNGVGFTDENTDSFNTSFSDYKLKLGGKGIGRLTWLVAFDRAEVSSIFQAADGLFERRFTFSADYDPDKVQTQPVSGVACGTTILLKNMADRYRKSAPKSLEAIALDMCEHFLLYFVREHCPTIELIPEGDPAAAMDLGQFFREHFSNTSNHPFTVRGHELRLTGARMKVSGSARHRLIFAADGREVLKEPLSRAIPNLPHPLGNEEERFTYCAIIHGAYLDQKVNSVRTDFEIDTEEDDQSDEEQQAELIAKEHDISLDEIRSAAMAGVTADLEPYLSEVRKAKSEALHKYVDQEAPHYRVLMRDAETLIDEIKPNATKLDIDLTLHAALYRKEAELKKLSDKVFLEADKIDDYEAYSAELSRYLQGENEVGLAALGKYVAHRKIMIDLLQRALSKVPADDRYPLERVVHNLIFPMRSTNDEILYSQQNLWLVDERLAYHSYVASDRPLNSSEAIEINSAKRPDIALFDRRFLFAEGDRPVSSVVLIEFKRPMRDDYNRDDPIDQILRVIEEIRKGNFLDGNGRPVAVASAEIPCFAHLVCDLTPTLRQTLESRDFTRHPDNQGYFNFHRNQRAYIEVISFEKLLGDAKKRNRVLFERLNWQT
jgi:hypothetical protein